MPYSLTPEFISRSIACIYDCAVDPSLWIDTLTGIRDEMDLAYIHLFFASPPNSPLGVTNFHTPWDVTWFHRLMPLLPTIPGMGAMRAAEVDSPISQMSVVDADSFYQTPFYLDWAGPQNLGDACNTTVLRRNTVEAWFSGTTTRNRGLFTEQDYTTFRLLAPHIRRALLIGDLIDEGRLQVALQRALLDQLSVAVFLVEGDGTIVLHNAGADALLSERRTLTAVSGHLRPVSLPHRGQFLTAIARAAAEESSLGTWGNGIALPGENGALAVAYVLPMGRSECRRALGPGNAAVFVTTRDDAQPPAAEVISALTGLTLAEARAALAISTGQSTEDAAQTQGISIHTLRKHLSNAYEKTGLNSQTALAAMVNGYRLPIRP
jgi:DNA-binding CsgD family transcriptional regulator/PAS domain-containing protein